MSEEKKQTPLVFIEGLRFFKPNEKAPETIKGNITLNIKELLSFITKQGIENEMRIDLRKSETKGTYYFTLNTWKPAVKTQDLPPVDYPSNELPSSPF